MRLKLRRIIEKKHQLQFYTLPCVSCLLWNITCILTATPFATHIFFLCGVCHSSHENHGLNFLSLYLDGDLWLTWSTECSRNGTIWLIMQGIQRTKDPYDSLLGIKISCSEEIQTNPKGETTERNQGHWPITTVIKHEWPNHDITSSLESFSWGHRQYGVKITISEVSCLNSQP